MTFGIVICSYKYGHLAAHCIESVLCQTKQFDKIWFVDDGAGDCEHLKCLYPQLNYIFRNENMGIVHNFNNVLMQVDTDYVMYLGADNWLRADTLERIAAEIWKIGIPDIITYDIMVTGELRDEIHQFYSPLMHKVNGDWYWNRKGGHHGSMVYNVKLAQNVGGYADNKTSNRTDEDLNLWDKMKAKDAKVLHISEAFLYYRRHKENFNKY